MDRERIMHETRSEASTRMSLALTAFGESGSTHFINPIIEEEVGTLPISSTILLFEKMGYEVDGPMSIAGYPRPDVVVSCAKNFGVNVEIVEGHSVIPSNVYVATFARGCYPVATGSYDMYRHDIDDDHFSAVLLGGGLMMRELQRYATEMQVRDDKELISNAAGVIDQFTSKFRDCIGDSFTRQECEYSIKAQMPQLKRLAMQMNISLGCLDDMLQGARREAAALGMDVLYL